MSLGPPGSVFAALLALSLLLAGGALPAAHAATVEARVKYISSSKKDMPPNASNVVIWLTPLSPQAAPEAEATLAKARRHFQLVQSHKRFDPHLLVVPVGSLVDFPNRDPFFHNVFSLFDGKRFDLGLYEAGSTRSVRFDRAGVSFIFCNIHPQMSAVVVVLKTPYYGVTGDSGAVKILNVPDGRYRVNMWSERALPQTLKTLVREVTVGGNNSSSLGLIQMKASGDLLADHKNKYDRDYEPANSSSSPYEQLK
ncbi:MAG: hypothetical protein ACRD2P_09915 [Terriglobia bacterium]